LTISCDINGIGQEAQLTSVGQKKIPTIPGFDCRFANLAAGGSAEKLRAFFAENVKTSWTREDVAKLIAKELDSEVNYLPMKPTVFESLAAGIRQAKDASKVARANAKNAKAKSEADSAALGRVVLPTSEPLSLIESRRADIMAAAKDLHAKKNGLDDERERWNRAQNHAVKSREAYDRAAATKPEDAIDVANIENELTLARAHHDRLAGFTATTCVQCGQSVPTPELTAAREQVEELRLELDAAKTTNERIARDSAARETRVAELLETANAAADVAKGLTAPAEVADLDAELAANKTKLDDVNTKIKALRDYDTTKKLVADAILKATEADIKLTECLDVEAAIARVRDRVVNESVEPIREALLCVSSILGGDPIVDMGDDENPPRFGIVKDGAYIGAATLSAGQRAMFLAGLAAGLLAQSPVGVDNRVLLLEAGEIDLENLVEVCETLVKEEIGHVVIAWQYAGDVERISEPFGVDGWVFPKWRGAEVAVKLKRNPRRPLPHRRCSRVKAICRCGRSC
jgi:hypothetical protein